MAGAKICVRGHAPQQYRLDGRLLALALAGHRGRAAAGHRPLHAARRHVGPRVRSPLGQLGAVLAGRAAGAAGHHGRRSRRRSKALYAEYTPAFAESESGVPAARIEEVAREVGRAGSALSTHVWRNAAAGNLRGWEVARALELVVVLAGAVATPGGTAPSRLEQGGPDPADDAAAGQDLERAPDAAGVPARLLRDELPAAAFPEGRPRQARDVLHPGLQPGVDQSGRHVVDRDADRRGQGGAARLPHAHVERDRVVRRLRAADGPRLRAPRPHEPGDPRRALDRLPPAGAAGGAREAGPALRPHLAGARGGGARAGVGGGRVLDRAVVAHRSGRRARDPQVLRVALSPRREAAHRGVLPLDLRAQRARPARGRRARGPDPARVHAQVRRVPGPGERLPHPRDAGRRGGGRGGGRAVDGRLPDAVAQARVLLADAQGVEVAGARGAHLRAQPRALARDEPGRGRDGAAAHLPAADPDPLALRQRQVALRDLPQQSAVASSGGCGAATT